MLELGQLRVMPFGVTYSLSWLLGHPDCCLGHPVAGFTSTPISMHTGTHNGTPRGLSMPGDTAHSNQLCTHRRPISHDKPVFGSSAAHLEPFWCLVNPVWGIARLVTVRTNRLRLIGVGHEVFWCHLRPFLDSFDLPEANSMPCRMLKQRQGDSS